jgi:DNA helicase II / ATP-dependent DNA helicase PcrA
MVERVVDRTVAHRTCPQTRISWESNHILVFCHTPSRTVDPVPSDNTSDQTRKRSIGPAGQANQEVLASLLSGLNPAQGAAVTSPALPLCILAGAGSGKTRVLTRRIAYRVQAGSADASRVLALTFTRKAARELSTRLGQLGVRERIATGTFHAIAYAQLRQWWQDTDQRAPELTESKMRLVGPLLGTRRTSVQPFDVVSEIEWAKARMLDPQAYAEEIARIDRKPPLGAEAMVDLYARYEADKKRKGVVDFDDLLVLCVRAMESDREFAVRQRWKFRHLFVDEFQDVNPAQSRLLDAWLGLGVSGDTQPTDALDLCVVGDPNQAIYAWNGADPRFLTGFRERFPNAEVIRLEDNYRSSPEILTAADAVLGLGHRDTRALRPHRPSGQVPVVTAFASDVDEAKGVARLLRDRHSSQMPWSHMAILTRTNAQSLLFEEALKAAGIPHRVKDRGAFLNQTDVKNALSQLKRSPAKVSFSARLADLEEMVRDANATGVVGAEGVNERAANLEGLVRLGVEFLALDAMGSTEGFLSWLAATITGKADEPDRQHNVVEITTFHRSKGLEWPIVVLAGIERGFVPIGQADNQDAWDEERRLMYVAITRAEKELHLTWAKSRTFGTRTTNRNESPYLANVQAAITSIQDPSRGDWKTVLREQRERLAAAKAAGVPGIRGTKRASIELGANADPQVLEALKRWRAAKARATGVPAFVICHDTTLAAMAEANPKTRDALLSVPGMGAVKTERYGDDIIAAIQAAAS